MTSFPGTDPSPHRGWHSRGYLPHCDIPGLLQSITFRLHDSVPSAVIDQWKAELGWQDNLDSADPLMVTLRRRIANYEDAGHGSCWLRQPAMAELVQHALLFFDNQRYRLIAWCIMPNHVHTLIETWDGWAVGKVINSWKRHTSRQANILLQRTGEPFWAVDYFDRFIRDDVHFENAVRYIHHNPVKAGLATTPENWPWSSAAPGNASL